MGNAETVLKKVLEKITPDDTERKKTDAALTSIKKATEEVIKPLKLDYTLAGSFLRDTWLPDKKEFDIFIMFPETVSREKLEKTGIDVGKKIVKALKGSYEIAYAEHPYIRAVVGEYAVDFVPCYDIKDAGKIKSAVDRTPHHNRYILKNITPALSSEVRLLKQFCKSVGVYGSDLRVEGFSGYLSELLVVRYRSFLNIVREASNWDAGKVFIDLSGHHKDEKPDVHKKYPGQPMIVIDPVDRNRNVAAALSPGNFEKFKESCRLFLKAPSEKYFRLERKVNVKGLSKIFKERKTKMISVVFKRPGVVDDIIFPQMRRSTRRIKGMLEDGDFRVIGSDVWCDSEECVMFLELEVWKLPKIKKLTGPPTFSKKHSEEFTKKYKGHGRIWVEGKNLVTEIDRKFTEADELVGKSLKVGKKALLDMGIASHVASGMSSGFTLLSDSRIVKKAEGSNELAFSLSNYFKNKIL